MTWWQCKKLLLFALFITLYDWWLGVVFFLPHNNKKYSKLHVTSLLATKKSLLCRQKVRSEVIVSGFTHFHIEDLWEQRILFLRQAKQKVACLFPVKHHHIFYLHFSSKGYIAWKDYEQSKKDFKRKKEPTTAKKSFFGSLDFFIRSLRS